MIPFRALPAALAAWIINGPAAADVVTMVNGDVYNGTVAVETLVVGAPYGRVELSHGRVVRLKREDDVVRLETDEGERFSGTLGNESLRLLRQFDPSLDLDGAEVAEIEFDRPPIRPRLTPVPDAVEAANGDVFRARVQTPGFMVMTGAGPREVKRDAAFLMDLFALEPEDPAEVQVTLNTPGRTVRGRMLNRTIALELRDGSKVEAPAAALSAMGFRVFHRAPAKGEPLRFAFRRHLPSAAVFRDPLARGGFGPEMVVVRGATFQRGDLQGDGDFDEKPAAEVTLPGPYAIGVTEVTFDDYDTYCEATDTDKPDDGDFGRGRRPVINVSWLDVQGYLEWLSEQTGQRYRLPTDAEWEYAARAGTATRFWWGQEPGTARANCEGCGSLWDGERTAVVGRFPPNPFGLHDTAGNVFEWVRDCWHDTFADAPADGSAIEKETGCGKRVIRGGAWSFPPKEIRSANRWRDFPSRQSDDTGFRVVRELGR